MQMQNPVLASMKSMRSSICLCVASVALVVTLSSPILAKTPSEIMDTAESLLELAQISYVYGGSQLGDSDVCTQCNTCLEEKSPEPKRRLSACPVCSGCSLDCSHFIELVYRLAGAPYPYIDTKLMISLSADRLRRSYKLEDLGTEVALSQPGDMFVYDGHVVMLEKLHGLSKGVYRGDIIHATGGKDIRLPGQGIQRERYVELKQYRGQLRRILRHTNLFSTKQPVKHQELTKDVDRLEKSRLRPIR
jgi:hypothetical protein